MIYKILLTFILLASSAIAQNGWQEWAWSTERIPYSREPTNKVTMWVREHDQHSNVYTDYYPGVTIPDDDKYGYHYDVHDFFVRAQDQRAYDCWHALKERYVKLGRTDDPFVFRLYRYDTENIEAIKAAILSLIEYIDSSQDPYDGAVGGSFTTNSTYPMFVDPDMATSYTGYGCVAEYDTNGLVRARIDEETVSHYSAMITFSNLLASAGLPAVWKNNAYTNTCRASVEVPVVTVDKDWWSWVITKPYYDPYFHPLDPDYISGTPTATWIPSYEFGTNFWIAHTNIPHACESWFDRTWWYQHDFTTNGYGVVDYGWGKIRAAISQLHVVAVPYLHVTQKVSRSYSYLVDETTGTVTRTIDYYISDVLHHTDTQEVSYVTVNDVAVGYTDTVTKVDGKYPWNSTLFPAYYGLGFKSLNNNYEKGDYIDIISGGWDNRVIYHGYSLPSRTVTWSGPSLLDCDLPDIVIPQGVVAKFVQNAFTRYNSWDTLVGGDCMEETWTTNTWIYSEDRTFYTESTFPGSVGIRDTTMRERGTRYTYYYDDPCDWEEGDYHETYDLVENFVEIFMPGARFVYAVRDLAGELKYP